MIFNMQKIYNNFNYCKYVDKINHVILIYMCMFIYTVYSNFDVTLCPFTDSHCQHHV